MNSKSHLDCIIGTFWSPFVESANRAPVIFRMNFVNSAWIFVQSHEMRIWRDDVPSQNTHYCRRQQRNMIMALIRWSKNRGLVLASGCMRRRFILETAFSISYQFIFCSTGGILNVSHMESLIDRDHESDILINDSNVSSFCRFVANWRILNCTRFLKGTS
jgi:hypothetical protein